MNQKNPTKAPKLGEHTKEILSSLGQDEEEIARLNKMVSLIFNSLILKKCALFSFFFP